MDAVRIGTHATYDTAPLREADFDPNPTAEFRKWIKEAEANGVPEFEAFNLGTVSQSGIPSNRILLMKQVDDDGWTFYTNYASRKGAELGMRTARVEKSANAVHGAGTDIEKLKSAIHASYSDVEDAPEPRYASLTFFWQPLKKSVRIIGLVEKVPHAQSHAYYTSRPRGSQIGAWASPQSEPIARDALEGKVDALTAAFKDTDVLPLPPYWGGVLVRPLEVEFWAGKPSRLHDRIVYKRGDLSSPWELQRVAP